MKFEADVNETKYICAHKRVYMIYRQNDDDDEDENLYIKNCV